MLEDQQLAHLPQLVELLNNPWFKHFQAMWEAEQRLVADAICLFPIKDFVTAITALECRGEYKTYGRCAKEPQETYDNLIQLVKEKENERDSRNTDE
jgi:hypothetical protein